MKIMNKAKKYGASVAVGTGLMLPVAANAGPVDDVVAAVKAGFTDANTIAIAVVVGFAGIFAIMLAKRLLR